MLSKASRRAMQGHKHRTNDMSDDYDNPHELDILAEQAEKLPYGPIGVICPRMEVTQDLPAELTDALRKCLAEEMLPSHLTEMVTAFLVRQISKPETKLIL